MQNGTVTETTEIIHSNGTVEDGPDLPKARDAHCMVLLPPGTKVIPIIILAHQTASSNQFRGYES